MEVSQLSTSIERPWLIIGFDNRSATIWDYTENKAICKLSEGHSSAIRAVSITDVDGPNKTKYILAITAGDDETAVVWDITNVPGRIPSSERLDECHVKSITSLACFKDNGM